MPITNHQLLFAYYWLFAIVFLTIYGAIKVRVWRKQMRKTEWFPIVMQLIKQSASGQLLLKKTFNPLNYIFGYLMLCIVAPVILPYVLFTIIKGLFCKPVKKLTINEQPHSTKRIDDQTEHQNINDL